MEPAQAAAASRSAASVASLPINAFSTAVRRIAWDPRPARAIEIAFTFPAATCNVAAAATIAKSPLRTFTSWKPQPCPFDAVGMRSSTRISSSLVAVSY